MKKPIDNPEIATGLPTLKADNSYDQYASHKSERKNIEKQKKQLQKAVVYLRRHAQETNKQLDHTQSELMNTYSKKLSSLESYQHKQELKELRQQKLEHKRNLSSLTRYLHNVKKQSAFKTLNQRNRDISTRVRQEYKETNKAKKQKDQVFLEYLQSRKTEMNMTMRKNTIKAKQKSLENKKNLSKNVRGELIKIEDSRITEQKETMLRLEEEKKKLMRVLKQERKKQQKLEDMKAEIQTMNLKEFQQRIKTVEETKEKEQEGLRKTNYRNFLRTSGRSGLFQI